MKKLNKRIVPVFLSGLGIIVLFRIIIFILNIIVINWELRIFPISQFINFFKSHTFSVFTLFGIIASILSILSLIFAGFFVGKKLQKKGFLCGIILGVLYFSLALILGLIFIFLPKDFLFGSKVPQEIYLNLRQTQINRLINGIPLDLVKTIVLTGVGGWLGERFSKRKIR